MPPGELQINVNQRRLLEETADRSAFVKVGDILEAFSLPEVDGGVVTLDGDTPHGILPNRPVVLIFFRLPAVRLAISPCLTTSAN
jgi:hypothetical protein